MKDKIIEIIENCHQYSIKSDAAADAILEIIKERYEVTRRDYFAAAAVSGMCGSLKYLPTSDPETIVQSAVVIADAMLEAREK